MYNKFEKIAFFSKRKIFFICLPIVSVCYILISVFSYTQKSPTFDEGIIISSGYHYLNTGMNSINPENPPLLKSLLASPLFLMKINKPEIKEDLKYCYNMNKELIYAGEFLYGNDAIQILNYSRLMNVLLTLLGAVFVYLAITVYLRRVYGLLGFVLFLFSPNILAHARLATVDTGIMILMFGANYFLLKAFKEEKSYLFLITGFMTGAAMLCKYTALIIIPIFFVQFIIYIVLKKQKNKIRNKILYSFKWFVLICLIALLTVNVFYRFKGCGKSLNDYTLKSSLLTHFQNTILIRSIPTLLPQDYVKGFDIVAYNNKPGFPNIFMGEYYPLGGSWWSYYFLIMGMKLPIPLLMLSVIGMLFSFFVIYRKWELYFFLIPPLAIFLNFSLLAYRQSGFRYILPILPYIILCAVIGFRYLFRHRKLIFRVLAFTILIYFFSESYSIYPDYLTYFNQFAGGPEGGKDYFAATNLDWGQDLPGLKKWLIKNNNPPIKLVYYGHANPSYYGIKQSKLPLYVVVSVTNMYVHGNDRYLSDLLATEPVANIGNSIYIFKALKSLNLSSH